MIIKYVLLGNSFNALSDTKTLLPNCASIIDNRTG